VHGDALALFGLVAFTHNGVFVLQASCGGDHGESLKERCLNKRKAPDGAL
jgi:hypothetical protein